MRPRDIRGKETADLLQEIQKRRDEIFKRRFHGQSEEKVDRGVLRKHRRVIARIKTILREREMASEAEGSK